MNIKFNSGKFLLVTLAISLTISSSISCDRQTLSVKDYNTSIPIERTGINGEYDPSGLAKRVARALEHDVILNGISTFYVAQNNNKIIIKGTIANKTFLDRLVTVASDVRGVGAVDVSQVEIISQVR
ncbi:hypothetical protein [Myxosarcina sp. GI1]|uniref:hypothetical protein n=1 Tax=Myxosarcina sp. GI1 TaxID=1541065 RepID=UPI00068F1284|nr:hypothetical protein [Myxosarcina sp. GI1]